jgi:uncharacterized protein (UPF0335 family)
MKVFLDTHHHEDIADLLSDFLSKYSDHPQDLDFATIQNDKVVKYMVDIISDQITATNSIMEYKDEIEELEEELDEANDKLIKLPEEIDFSNMDGNDDMKKVILLKAYEKYTVQELETRLELDWLSL